jgi:hypothetical protein
MGRDVAGWTGVDRPIDFTTQMRKSFNLQRFRPWERIAISQMMEVKVCERDQYRKRLS